MACRASPSSGSQTSPTASNSSSARPPSSESRTASPPPTTRAFLPGAMLYCRSFLSHLLTLFHVPLSSSHGRSLTVSLFLILRLSSRLFSVPLPCLPPLYLYRARTAKPSPYQGSYTSGCLSVQQSFSLSLSLSFSHTHSLSLSLSLSVSIPLSPPPLSLFPSPISPSFSICSHPRSPFLSRYRDVSINVRLDGQPQADWTHVCEVQVRWRG